MICLICRRAQLVPTFTNVKLEQQEIIITVRRIPASVCPDCKDTYLDEETATRLLRIVDRCVKSGKSGELLEYSLSD